MANARSRKAAPPRPATAREKRSGSSGTRPGPRTAEAADDLDPTDTDDDVKPVKPVKPPKKATSSAPTEKAALNKPAKPAKASAKAATAGRRFGDGGTAGARESTSANKSGRGGGRGGSGRGGGGSTRRPAPRVRVAAPKPWGTIAATVAVVLFAVAAIGYAVVQANSSAVPESADDIEGISVLEYAAGQEHVTTDVPYTETPPVGGPHDGYWADCDGAVYDVQIRSENAVHSLEHGAVWITYNPDEVNDEDLAVLAGYVQSQPYMLLSPFAGLSAPVSLQSWNHQLFVDAVDDPRITGFIQTLRQNPEEYPEVGASCSQPLFLQDPVLEGEPSRVPETGTPVTDAPSG